MRHCVCWAARIEGVTIDPGPRSISKVVAIFGVALAAGLVLALLAPADWDEGTGEVGLAYRGSTVIASPADIGGVEPLTLTGSAGCADVTLSFLRGVPI